MDGGAKPGTDFACTLGSERPERALLLSLRQTFTYLIIRKTNHTLEKCA